MCFHIRFKQVCIDLILCLEHCGKHPNKRIMDFIVQVNALILNTNSTWSSCIISSDTTTKFLL